jgi:Tol biopolymer transport system component
MNVGDANPFRLTDQPEPEFSPVWSPDGKTIALMRLTGADQVSLVLKPVAGGAERIATSWRSPAVPFWEQATRIRHLDWTPDGGSLIVSAPPSDQAPDNSHNLFVLSLASGERRAITHAPPAQFDLLPAVSSDGRHVAFVRDTGVLASSLWIVDLGSGAEPRKVAIPGFEEVAITGVQWTPGGREVIFAADVTNLGMLWRTVPFSAQEPTRVEGVAFPVARNAFSISRNGGRLAYESRLIDMNVWTLDVAGRTPPQQVTQSTRIDYFGRFSPDGSRIVFASNQTGSFQIWICDRSGANAQMITHMDHGTSGAPVWSPDGKWIAFDSREGDNADLYKVAASGGPVIRLTDNPGADVTPSWSRDGRSIYFSSTRSGRTEIWKLPASGGAATQITRNGGTFPMVAPGGDRIFFIRSDHDYSVWSVPSDGGEDRRELDRVNNRGFVPARDGVFFVLDGKIRFRDFKSGRVREIAAPARRLLPILDLSPDGKTLSITQIDQMQQDLMLIDHLVW